MSANLGILADTESIRTCTSLHGAKENIILFVAKFLQLRLQAAIAESILWDTQN